MQIPEKLVDGLRRIKMRPLFQGAPTPSRHELNWSIATLPRDRPPQVDEPVVISAVFLSVRW